MKYPSVTTEYRDVWKCLIALYHHLPITVLEILGPGEMLINESDSISFNRNGWHC